MKNFIVLRKHLSHFYIRKKSCCFLWHCGVRAFFDIMVFCGFNDTAVSTILTLDSNISAKSKPYSKFVTTIPYFRPETVWSMYSTILYTQKISRPGQFINLWEYTVRKFNRWRYCLTLCGEIFDHFPLFDETLRHMQ